MHFGVILPNYGLDASTDAMRRTAELAEELGFDSVWATEHVIVGPEARDPYGRVYEPFTTLGWIAGWTERLRLGTSIVILPLHNPIEVAKQAATLQELSGGRFTLGVGMGWYQPEFEFMGMPFNGRGRRGDEAIRLMRTLWKGEFQDATFEPLPSKPPEIWVGGSSAPAIRRAVELGDAWHPSRGSDAGHVRRVKEQHPELRVIPRTAPEHVDAMLDAGAEGAVVQFADENQMRDFARRL